MDDDGLAAEVEAATCRNAVLGLVYDGLESTGDNLYVACKRFVAAFEVRLATSEEVEGYWSVADMANLVQEAATRYSEAQERAVRAGLWNDEDGDEDDEDKDDDGSD